MGSFDGPWYIEYNGSIFVAIPQPFMEWAIFFSRNVPKNVQSGSGGLQELKVDDGEGGDRLIVL